MASVAPDHNCKPAFATLASGIWHLASGMITTIHMARRLYRDRMVGDIGFSHNGWAALKRGERPLHMFTNGERVGPTQPHHIEVPFRAGGTEVQRKLVMFYRVMKDAGGI